MISLCILKTPKRENNPNELVTSEQGDEKSFEMENIPADGECEIKMKEEVVTSKDVQF